MRDVFVVCCVMLYGVCLRLLCLCVLCLNMCGLIEICCVVVYGRLYVLACVLCACVFFFMCAVWIVLKVCWCVSFVVYWLLLYGVVCLRCLLVCVACLRVLCAMYCEMVYELSLHVLFV